MSKKYIIPCGGCGKPVEADLECECDKFTFKLSYYCGYCDESCFTLKPKWKLREWDKYLMRKFRANVK